jgi:hypothetical protein
MTTITKTDKGSKCASAKNLTRVWQDQRVGGFKPMTSAS